MCSRYKLAPDRKELGRLLDIEWKPEFLTDDEIRPSDLAPVVRSQQDVPVVHQLSWGFPASWNEGGNQLLINARSESAHEKPTFRESFAKRRCVVPASMYFEWREEEVADAEPQGSLFGEEPKARRKHRRKYRFQLADEPLMLFAGLWQPTSTGLDVFTILTTEANSAAREIHPRMPCILDLESSEVWLDKGVQSVERLQEILRPVDAGRMLIAPVKP